MIFVLGITFAWLALILISNFTPNYLIWIVTATLTFVITLLILAFTPDVVFYIEVGIFVLWMIATWIKKHLE